MKPIVFAALLWIGGKSYTGPQKETKPKKQHTIRQNLYGDGVACCVLVGDFTTAIYQNSCYQQTKAYLIKAFGPEYLAAWILVIAAVIGIRYTIKTLGVLSVSANAAKNAADVAWLNAQAVINSERAWLLLDRIKPEGIDGSVFNTLQGMELPVLVQLKNFGKTPAWIVDWCCKFRRADVANFQGPMDYGNAKSGGEYAVAPDGGIFPVFTDGDTIVLDSSDIERIRREEMSLILYGRVRYRDAFETKNQPIRETCFCVRLLVYAYGPAASWQLTGPDGANRCK